MTDQQETSWNAQYRRFLKHHGLDTDEDAVIHIIFKHLSEDAVESIDDNIAVVFSKALNMRVVCVPYGDPIFTEEFLERLVNPCYTLHEVCYENRAIQEHFGSFFVAYQLDIVHEQISLSAPQQAYYSGKGWELDAS